MIKSRVKESATLALLDRVRTLQAEGKDLVSFAAGESDFPTPDCVTEAAYAAIKNAETRYVSSQGTPRFRKAVAQDYVGRLGVSWVNESHVLATVGSKQGLYLALAAILEPGDDVIVPKPYWVSYPSLVKANMGNPLILETTFENNFFPTVEDLKKIKTSKTKALIFSSPNNPTGAMISKPALQKIVDWCIQEKIYLLYDELYDRIVLGDQPHVSALACCTPEGANYILSINAASKSMAMTGWRVGYLVSSPENIKALTALQSQMITCIPGFAQTATAVGLERMTEFLPATVTAFQKRAILVESELKKFKNIRYIKPQGAFYAFVDFSEVIKNKNLKDDVELAEILLTKFGVVVLPGASSGMPNWIRISFATSEEKILDGMKRIQNFCES